MPAIPAGGVQQADIELAGFGDGVVLGDIVGDGAVGEALAVDHHVEPGDGQAVRGGGIEHARAFRPGELAGEHGLRVVVAADGEHGDAGAGEPPELSDQEVSGGVVLPVAIEKVPGEQDEGDVFAQGEVHEVGEGLSRGAADALGVHPGFEPAQGRVEVQVGGVEKGEVHSV